MLQCTLYNATYKTNFTYVNGEQRVDMAALQFLNTVRYIDQVQVSSTGDQPSYNASLQTAQSYQFLYETLAYQAVMEAFGRLMVGAISEDFQKRDYDDTSGPFHQTITSNMYTANTSVMSTQLANTKELAVIKNATDSVNSLNTFQYSWQEHSVSNSAAAGWQASLLDTVEEMFQNITISFMSSSSFQ